MPALFLTSLTGLSAWATWSLTGVKPGDYVLGANVMLRAKYFDIITLALNIYCTGRSLSLPVNITDG